MTTEKRFTITDDGIVDNLSKKQYTKIKSNDDILDSISFTNLIEVVECLNALHEENNELKTFKDKVFALIDARIEIYKHKPFMAPVSAPMSVNFDEDTDRLARLSELEQLKKELK